MSTESSRFHWLDYVIFAIMLALSCVVGIYYAITGAHKQTQDEYLMGNRRLKWLAVAISLQVSYYSAISQLGKPAEVYQYGIQYFTGIIGVALAVIISAYTFVPLLFRLQLTSSYEYLEMRFQSKAVRRVGTFLLCTSELLYIGIATYSPAIALETVTGFPVWSSIICVGAVATFYTTLRLISIPTNSKAQQTSENSKRGGMKAVIWTDTLQSLVIVGGMVAVIIAGVMQVGGVEKVWLMNQESGRLNFFDFSISPTVRLSFWSLLVGRTVLCMQSFSVGQTSVQRFSSVPTLQKARLTILSNIPLQLFLDMLCCMLGLVVYSYFVDCDPLNDPDPNNRISSPNQLVPLFVMKVVKWPGVTGVFLALIFSGSLSTVSSCLSSLATVTWEDLLKWKFDYLTDRFKTNILRGLVLVYGVCGIGMAYMVSFLQGSVLQVVLSFKYTANSPLLGLFLLGAFFTRANWLGAIGGSILGLTVSMWISLGSYLAVPRSPPLNTSISECVWNGTDPGLNATVADPQTIVGFDKLYTISFLWFPVIGTFTTLLIGMIVSLVTGCTAKRHPLKCYPNHVENHKTFTLTDNTDSPFIESVQPYDIDDAYLIFPLDRRSRKNKNRPNKTEAVNESELKELVS